MCDTDAAQEWMKLKTNMFTQALLIRFFNLYYYIFFSDHQKLEREARICRLLKHSNIGLYKL